MILKPKLASESNDHLVTWRTVSRYFTGKTKHFDQKSILITTHWHIMYPIMHSFWFAFDKVRYVRNRYFFSVSFPGGSEGKASACKVEDLCSIPGSEGSPGEGNGNPHQYSDLQNPMDGEAWCRLQSMGLQRVGHNWATSLSLSVIQFKIWSLNP